MHTSSWPFALAVVGVAAMLAVLFATSNLSYLYAARFGGGVALNSCVALQYDATTGALKMPSAEELKRIDESIYHYREALSTGLWIAMFIVAICIVYYAILARQCLLAPHTPARVLMRSVSAAPAAAE